MKRFRATAVTALLMLCAFGCAPAVVLENPVEWPQEYAKRQLHNTPSAFIYASSDAAAGEADRLVIAVAKDFEKMTGRKATKGLVFVTEVEDAPLVPNLKKIIDLEVRKKSAEVKAKEAVAGTSRIGSDRRGGSPHPPSRDVCDTKREGTESLPYTSPVGPVSATDARGQVKDKTRTETKTEDPLEKWNEAQKKLEELGLSMDMVLRAMPAPVPKGAASSFLGLPKDMTEKSAWIMAMPTKAVIRDLVRKMIVTGIGKADYGPFGKAMVGLLLGVVNIERTMTDGFAMTRDVVLFSIWVNAQPDWSEAEKRKKIEAYVEKRKQETISGFTAAMIKRAEEEEKARKEKQGGQNAPETDELKAREAQQDQRDP